MKTGSPARKTEPNELADAPRWKLRLYISGQTPKSLTAFANLKRICERYLAGRYEIDVVDLLEFPGRAKEDQIVAIPTLVRRMPLPVKKAIGDLSDEGRVVVRLDLPQEAFQAESGS